MPKTNKMLLKLECFQYATTLDLKWDIIISELGKTQVTYVRLFSLVEILIQASTNGSCKLARHF